MKQIIQLSGHTHLVFLRPTFLCRRAQIRFISGDKSDKTALEKNENETNSREKNENILEDKDEIKTVPSPTEIKSKTVEDSTKKILELNPVELQSKYMPKHMR